MKSAERWCVRMGQTWKEFCAGINKVANKAAVKIEELSDSASLYMPGNSITSALANEFAEAESGLHVAALMELGLILFVITFIVLAASKFMIMRLAKNEGAR